jgi:hypothetical protein
MEVALPILQKRHPTTPPLRGNYIRRVGCGPDIDIRERRDRTR